MLILAAAVAAGSTAQMPPRSPAAARVEARATVRILSGARLHLGDGYKRDGFVRRDSIIRTADGREPAKLIEFE